jgi:hypothetical protein
MIVWISVTWPQQCRDFTSFLNAWEDIFLPLLHIPVVFYTMDSSCFSCCWVVDGFL